MAETPPGFLSGLFGVKVEEFGRLDAGELSIDLGAEVLPSGEGYEILEPLTAVVHGLWQGPLSFAATGRPAVTIRRQGAGQAVYLGTGFSHQNKEAIIRLLLGLHPLEPLGQADPFVEITCRRDKQKSLTFLLNHYPESREVSGLPHGTELLTGAVIEGTLEVPGFGVKVIRSSA
ncbi:MAG: Beta-galactosidase C-terminal domain [Terrimicrobiaceae bacterium]